MNQTNGASHRIDHENRAAIRDINAQGNAALICDQTIRAIEAPVSVESDSSITAIPFPCTCSAVAKAIAPRPRRCAKSAMNLIEPGQRLLPIGRDIDPGDSANKSVPDRIRAPADAGKNSSDDSATVARGRVALLFAR